jgi:hypothetical protein
LTPFSAKLAQYPWIAMKLMVEAEKVIPINHFINIRKQEILTTSQSVKDFLKLAIVSQNERNEHISTPTKWE